MDLSAEYNNTLIGSHFNDPGASILNPLDSVKPINPFNPTNPVNLVNPVNPINPVNPVNIAIYFSIIIFTCLFLFISRRIFLCWDESRLKGLKEDQRRRFWADRRSRNKKRSSASSSSSSLSSSESEQERRKLLNNNSVLENEGRLKRIFKTNRAADLPGILLIRVGCLCVATVALFTTPIPDNPLCKRGYSELITYPIIISLAENIFSAVTLLNSFKDVRDCTTFLITLISYTVTKFLYTTILLTEEGAMFGIAAIMYQVFYPLAEVADILITSEIKKNCCKLITAIVFTCALPLTCLVYFLLQQNVINCIHNITVSACSTSVCYFGIYAVYTLIKTVHKIFSSCNSGKNPQNSKAYKDEERSSTSRPNEDSKDSSLGDVPNICETDALVACKRERISEYGAV